MNYSLAETAWDLHYERLVGGLDRYVETYKRIMASDRGLSIKPSLKIHFVETIKRDLKQNQISVPMNQLESFAKWIYKSLERYPSQRLLFEIWHKLVKNITDEPTPSDLEDLVHIVCLPYVDLLTLDKRMYEYTKQSCTSIGINYLGKVYKNSYEIVEKLGNVE